jgi:hypothetical protein
VGKSKKGLGFGEKKRGKSLNPFVGWNVWRGLPKCEKPKKIRVFRIREANKQAKRDTGPPMHEPTKRPAAGSRRAWKSAPLVTALVFHADSKRKERLAEEGERQIAAFLDRVQLSGPDGNARRASDLFEASVAYGKTEKGAREGETVTFFLAPKASAWLEEPRAASEGHNSLENHAKPGAGAQREPAMRRQGRGARAVNALAKRTAKLFAKAGASAREGNPAASEREAVARAAKSLMEIREQWLAERLWGPIIAAGIAMSDQSKRWWWDPAGIFGSAGADPGANASVVAGGDDGAPR